MTAALIGISSGLLIILLIWALRYDKTLVYGLSLAGIGFIYVGFAWSNPRDLIINCIQAFVFLNIAYIGMRRSTTLLAAGFFLHGGWDLVYSFFNQSSLIPPHYDLFCSTLDFVLGIYVILFKVHFQAKKNI